MTRSIMKIYIFDDTGDQFEVSNVKGMLMELLDEDVIMLYKSTKYFNELHKAMAELIELKLMTKTEGDDYDEASVARGLFHFKSEIVKRFGKDELKLIDDEVELDWEANKPDLSKYKK